jgi:hypothetical protein
MPIYSDQIQQLTDQLVTDVTNLHDVVTTDPSNFQAITDATNIVAATANSLDQAIKSADIPPDNTMILNLSTQILLEIDDLNAAITANDSNAVVDCTNEMVVATSNLNRCVTAMAEQIVYPPTPDQTPVPPWLGVPMAQPPDPTTTQTTESTEK